MSTFDGPIREIPGISVDRFDGENLKSSVFFLSHCHTDHMQGLENVQFQKKLVLENKYLYLSTVSAVILRVLYPGLTRQIKELPLEQGTSIELESSMYISVTCIPAGHCPGSVMFLFETDKIRILYTGDYRIHAHDITKFRCFYDVFGIVKSINKIYLDTTFFLESYRSFPKRETSLSELCNVILQWTSQHPKNSIKLNFCGRYGYEYVFTEIYKVCKMQVHVNKEKFQFCSVIPEMDRCVTTNGSSTQIHSCYCPSNDILYNHDIHKVKTVKLSAFRWKNRDFNNSGVSEFAEDGILYICYSTHASYEEGLALLDFLKPNAVHVCVDRPKDPITNANIRKLIDKQLNKDKPQNKLVEVPMLFDVVTEVQIGSSIDISKCEPEVSSSLKTFKNDNILDSPP
ncbi:protein artemis [Euwallacea fornicatus]|uniref:protein artemis n=1 Tax=Euwallacea fornicatus TaxID=995702 RepID=UPI00338D920B